MWTRRELKEKAKERLRLNYWKCVLAAVLMAVLCGGAGLGSGGVYSSFRGGSSSDEAYDAEDYEDDGPDLDLDALFGEDAGGPFDFENAVAVTMLFLMLAMILAIVAAVVLVVILPLEIFILNPLEVGISRFFMRNLKEQANVRESCYAYDHGYKNCVKVMFFRELYIFLWSLLLIIPGLIKSYEYRMVPYILGENPHISKGEALARSSSMMRGNKWRAFVLDLSFLGWYILSGLTLGVLAVFYVNPYVYETRAALYQRLKAQLGETAV